jgi:hypothetical protein
MRQFIRDRQLNRLRSLNQRGMPDRATILVPGPAESDGYGAEIEPFTDGPTVACRFRPTTQRADSVQGGKGSNQELFLFLLPVDTVIDNTYRLRRKGVVYEVVGQPTDSTHQLSIQVLVKKL